MKIIALLVATVILTSCADYQKTVASRSDSLHVDASKDTQSGSIGYTHSVTYR